MAKKHTNVVIVCGIHFSSTED